MPLAAAGETRVLDALLDGVYVSLHTDNPGTTGANEVSESSYVRQPASFANTGSNPTTAANTGIVQFPQAEENWGEITHFGLWSAETDGDFLGWAAVLTPKEITIGDVARWEIGSLEVVAD